MEETPPSVLRKRLERKNAALEKLEAEFQEHLEFTTCERQFYFIEKGMETIETQNDQLRKEVRSTFTNFNRVLELVQSKFEEKNDFFMELRNKTPADVTNCLLGPLEEGQCTVGFLLDEVVTTFSQMSSVIQEQRASNLVDSDNLFTRLDKLESSGKELQTNLDIARRLSADRNSVGLSANSDNNKATSQVANLLDITIPDFPQQELVNSDVQDLERRLAETLKDCQELTSDNLNLQAALAAKDSEIQALTLKLLDYEQEDEPAASFCQNLSNFSYSGLPTIQETRESLDSIFSLPNENSPRRVSASQPAGNLSPNKSLQPQDPTPSPLSRILSTELDHCMSEIQDRDEHVALLYKTFHQLLASKRKEAVVPDKFVLSEEESVQFDNAQLKADSCDSYMELLQKLEKVLSSIQKNVEATLSLPEFKLENISDSKNQPTDFGNESIFSSSIAPCAQEMCAVVLDASAADFTQTESSATVQSLAKKNSHVDILKRVRNLMSTLMGILTNFNSDVLNVVDELLRFEYVLEKINKSIFGEEAFSNEKIYMYDDFCTKVFLAGRQSRPVEEAGNQGELSAHGKVFHASSARPAESEATLEESSCGMEDSSLHLSMLERFSKESELLALPLNTGRASTQQEEVREEDPKLKGSSTTLHALKSLNDQASHSISAMGDASLHLSLLEHSFNQQTAQASPRPQLISEANPEQGSPVPASNDLNGSASHSISTMGDTTLHLSLLERSFNQQTAQASPRQQLNSEDNSHSEQHADCLSAQKLKSLLEWLLAVESKLVGLGVKVTNNRVEQPDSLVSERVLLLAESLKTELSSSPISQNNCDPGQDSLQLNQDAIHKSSPLKPLQDLSNVDNKENSCVNRAPPKSWNQQFDKSTIATQDDLPEKVVQQLRESATRLLELEGTILTLEQELQETTKRLKETSEDSSKIIEDLKSFNSDLNANLSLKSTECLDLLKCLENRSEELIVLQQKVEANESASLRMSQEFDELKKIAGSSEVRILELEGSVSDLQTVLTQTRDNWSQLVRSSCSYLDELSETKRVIELNSVAGRVEMSEKLEAVERDLLKMEQSVLLLTTDHKATILSKDGIIDNLRQENTKLAGEIENLRLLNMQMESLETELTIAKESFAKLKSDQTESLDKIGRLNTELLAAADEKTRLASLLEDAENKLADSSALDEAKETILKMSSELDSARLTILELKEKMPPENVFNTPSSFKPARHGQKATPAQMVSSNSTSTTPMSSRSSAQLDESTLDSYVRSTDETSRHEVSCVVPVEFERSVFVADLLTDRTLCGVDPLSMTVGNGEFLDVAGYSSDDSEFATPVANRSHRNSPLKKLAANQVFPESVELMEKLKNYQDELQLLQEERDQLSQSCETTKLVLDNICETIDKTFLVLQDDIPDLAVDQKLAILADKISSLARTVKGSTVSSQVNLTSAVELLVEDRLRTASFHAGILDHLHYGSKVLRDECGSIKDSFLQLNSTLNQNIEEVVSSFGDMNNSYQQLMKQLADQTSTIGDLRVATESSSNEIVRLTQELDSVQKELKDASEGNSALERKLIESESLCANLIVEKGSVVESKKDLEQKVLEFIQSWRGDFSLPACLNDVWESVILEVLSLKKSADALKATLEKEEISSVVKTIKNECIKLRGEAASSQKDVEASLAKATEVLCMLVDELRSQEGLRVELSTMEEQLKGCQERIAQFQSTIEESNSSCESLGKNLKILEEENQALRRANGSLEKVLQESATDAKENDRLKMENEKLSADIAKFKETVTDLNDRLTACQSQLEALHERSDQHCGTCSSHESDLKSVTSALTSLVVSTANQPIDLTCQLENACDIILFTNNVLEKSNVIISTILRSLNLTEMSGFDALESIHDRLNQSEIEDAVMCKKKMCEEICGLDADVDKRELVTLSLVELQSKLVSLIMEKEVHLINDYQMRYDKQIASLDEELKCLVEKEKRTNEYNQHLLKECENLERTLSSYQTNANPTQQNNLLSSPKKDVPGRRNDEDRQSYANEIRALKNQIELLEKNFDELKSSSSKEIVELKGFLHRLVECLESFLDRTDASESLDLNVESFPLAGQNSVVDNLRRLLSEIFEKFSQHKALICDLKKISEDQVETISRLNDCVHNLTEQRDNCSSAAAAVQASLLENKELLKSKEDCIRAMEKERIDIQTQLEDLKASLQSKEAEVVDLKNTMESELAKNLADHQRNVADLRNRALSDGLFKVSGSLKGLSKHLALTKDEVMHLQRENGNNISGIVSGINGQVARFVDSEREKLAAGFDAKISHLHQDLKVLKDDKNQLISEKLKLEKSIHELENEKDAMSKRLKESSEVQVVVGHDEDTCPYREKVTELKKEVYIARQRVEEEKRKFDMTKVNMEEELAMKCSSIAELESRIETTTNEFKQRLATVTVSYNQKCVELERCEATVSLLRDMNAQDKQSLEKELDSLAKELARLQSARKFVEELGVDVSSDSIAALKKKLSDIDELTKEVEELEEKNADLDSECEFMNKEIQFLEVRNGETYKECVEKTERLENLEKEHKQELAELSKRLETELDRAKQLAIQSQNELSAQLADVRNRLAAQAEANVQLQNAYSQLEHSLETCNKKILIYLNQIRDLEQTIMEKNKSIEEMKQALDTQQVEYAQLRNQKICSQESLAAMESEMIRLQQTLQQTNAEIESMRRVVENATQVEASSIQRIQVLEIQLAKEAETMKAVILDREQKIESLEKLLFEASQVDRIEKYKSKITSLEREIALLKQEVQNNVGHYPSPRRVDVKQVVSEDATVDQYQRSLKALDKKYQVMKKLAQMRRSQLIEYERTLKMHNINLPSNSQHSDNTS